MVAKTHKDVLPMSPSQTLEKNGGKKTLGRAKYVLKMAMIEWRAAASALAAARVCVCMRVRSYALVCVCVFIRKNRNHKS